MRKPPNYIYAILNIGLGFSKMLEVNKDLLNAIIIS